MSPAAHIHKICKLEACISEREGPSQMLHTYCMGFCQQSTYGHHDPVTVRLAQRTWSIEQVKQPASDVSMMSLGQAGQQ